jgi:hypothetical protein
VEKEPQLETPQIQTDLEKQISTKVAKIQERLSEKRIRILVFTLISLLIALLICGGFKFAKLRQAKLPPQPMPTTIPIHTPTTQPIIEEEIANFKVFKHYGPHHRYSIKYPANLDVILVGATSGNARFSFKTKEEIEVNLVIINFFPDKIPPISDLDKIQQPGEGGYYKLIPDFEKIVQKEEIKMAGFRGLKVSTIKEEQREQVYEYILLPVKNKIVDFQLSYKFPKPASLDDIPESVTTVIAQIINTYGQLKEPPLNWKLYSDKRFPIGINYPSNWNVEQKSEKENYIISFRPLAIEKFGESSIKLHFLPNAKEAMTYELTKFEQFVQKEENASQEALNLERYAFTFLQGGDYAIKVIPPSRKTSLSIYFPCQDAKCVNYLIRADLFVENNEAFEELSEIFDQMLISFNKIFLED